MLEESTIFLEVKSLWEYIGDVLNSPAIGMLRQIQKDWKIQPYHFENKRILLKVQRLQKKIINLLNPLRKTSRARQAYINLMKRKEECLFQKLKEPFIYPGMRNKQRQSQLNLRSSQRKTKIQQKHSYQQYEKEGVCTFFADDNQISSISAKSIQNVIQLQQIRKQITIKQSKSNKNTIFSINKQPQQAEPIRLRKKISNQSIINQVPLPIIDLNLSSQQYFQIIIKYAQSQVAFVQTSELIANLGGAKSSLNDLFITSKSLLSSINDNQLTAFAIKLYNGIIMQISTSNMKNGIYRIPPKCQTDQVQKNSINCYILYVNLFRMMGYEKIWIIVFGKLLKLLEFIYKRKEDLKHYSELDLLTNKHFQKKGEIQGKYLSRIDYLIYMLFGLTAYDPLMIFRQIEQKESDIKQSRQELQSLDKQWSYKQFWILVDLILKNKHDSYFKPILFMNFLYILYPKIYEHKQDPSQFRAENQLYKLLLDQGKRYFSLFKTNKELKILNVTDSKNGVFNYDGDNFVQGIKVLNVRLGVQKCEEFNLNARQFEQKSNVFYYFSKQK